MAPSNPTTSEETISRDTGAKAVSQPTEQAAALDRAVDAAIAASGAGKPDARLDAEVEAALVQAKQSVADSGSSPRATIAPGSESAGVPAPPPANEIKQLDATLAANAASAAAAADEFEDVTPKLAAKPPATAPTAPAPAPAQAPKTSKPAEAQPAPAKTPAPTAAPAAATSADGAPSSSRAGSALAPLMRRFEPVAARLAALSPGMRQTIGWAAIMTAFNALWVWGFVLLKSPQARNHEGEGKAALMGLPPPHPVEPEPAATPAKEAPSDAAHGDKPAPTPAHGGH